MKQYGIFPIIFLVLYSVFFRQIETSPDIWGANTMRTVMPNDKVEPRRQVKIWAAKGEYEPVQIVVSASTESLTNVKLSLSPLKGKKFSIGQNHIEVYRQHYVNTEIGSPVWRGPPNLPLGAGMYPDALIPLTSSGDTITKLPAYLKSVEKGMSQPYWIDIFIPLATPTGKYEGVCTVETSQGTSEIDISLTVWDFELPHRPSLRSMFGVWESHNNSDEVLLKHKLMPFSFPKNKIRYYDKKFGINTIGSNRWSGADVKNHTMKPAPSVDDWKAIEESFPEEYRKMLANYTADEIDGIEKLLPPLKEWAKNMHTGSTIKNLITVPPTPQLYDDGTGRPVVDIWVLLPFQTQSPQSKKNIEYVMSLGNEVWTYTALLQDNYSPKWMIDFPSINYRIHAWINQIYGYNGILYWRVDMWSENPWASFGKENYYPGDGMLVYPGDPVGFPGGVLPSIRLKHIRESIEDYEYIEILKSMGDEKFAMDTIKTVAKDWKNWTRDEEELMKVRYKLGERIHYLKSKQKVSNK